MDFRTRLLRTLHVIEPLLQSPGVLVIGSEVPNLLQPGAGSTLVVSQDVDIGVPVSTHAAVKAGLGTLQGLRPSEQEPSVWVPESTALIEVNFIGIDPALHDTTESYVLDDPQLPLLVFGALSYLEPGDPIEADGLTIPVPRPAGLILEKLMTERSGVKGERDLLVVLALLLVSRPADLDEVVRVFAQLSDETRQTIRNNLTLLSLLEPVSGMPDPRPHRRQVAQLLARLEPVRGRAPMSPEGLHARIRAARSRATVLKWEARQATLAHGIWYRLRRLLAFSCELWAVDDATMNELIAGGCPVALEGEQLNPPKRIVLLPSTDHDRLAGGRQLPLGLHREVLAAANLVLVLWEDEDLNRLVGRRRREPHAPGT